MKDFRLGSCTAGAWTKARSKDWPLSFARRVFRALYSLSADLGGRHTPALRDRQQLLICLAVIRDKPLGERLDLRIAGFLFDKFAQFDFGGAVSR